MLERFQAQPVLQRSAGAVDGIFLATSMEIKISVCRETLNEELFQSADETLGNHGMPSALLYILAPHILNTCFQMHALEYYLWEPDYGQS